MVWQVLATTLKRYFLVSDNDAYNRLYEFVGRAEINKKLQLYGLTTSRILNRYAVKDTEITSRHTNPVSFYSNGKLVYRQTGQFDAANYVIRLTNTLMGRAYMDSSDNLVNRPFNMAGKNAFSLTDQQQVMKKLLFPEVLLPKERFKLTADDYRLLYTYMSMYPTESKYPAYNPSEYGPVSCKFIFLWFWRNTQKTES